MSKVSFQEQVAEGAYIALRENDEISARLSELRRRSVQLSMRARYVGARAKLVAEAKRWDFASMYLGATGTIPVIWANDARDWLTKLVLLGFFSMALFGLTLSRKATRYRKRARRLEARFGYIVS
jgi:hypothetical protein